MDQTAERLLGSASRLSRDPETEIDWDAPVGDGYGMSPERSTLYGTPYWDELTEAQQRELTRHEAASVATTGIWFELILQQLILRDVYDKPARSAEFQGALTEIADECRHSIMFARATERLVEPAYAAILVAEEVLDVMQRDWMRDRRVEPMVRTVNHIHVVEESRHMVFAREETRERLAGAGRGRRWVSALVIAIAADMIVSSMVGRAVYANVGLDADRAVREARCNEHHRSLLRASCANLMDFLGSVGLLTPAAARVYRRTGLL